MIYFYIISVIVYFNFIFRKKHNILSPFVIFGLFSFVYSFFPWLYLNSEVEIFLFSGDVLKMESANKILLLQTLTNFTLCLLIRLPTSGNLISIIKEKDSIDRINFKSIYWIVYPIALILVWFFPWGEKEIESSLGNSIAAASKNFLLIAFCIYCNRSSSFKKFLAFVSFLLLCAIDTSRTTLFVLIFLYAFYTGLSWKRLLKYLYLVLPIFFLFVWITLKRNNINFEFKYILWVFYTESLLGGYSTFQSISIVKNNMIPFYSFLYPIIDMFIYIVPSVFFDFLGLIKSNSFLTTNYFKSLYDYGFLSEEYAPMGGHFYIAEFYLYFRFFMPFFIFLYYYFFLIIIKSIRYKEIALILFCSSFLLVKASIYNNFKFFLSVFILSYFLLFLNKVGKLLIKTI